MTGAIDRMFCGHIQLRHHSKSCEVQSVTTMSRILHNKDNQVPDYEGSGLSTIKLLGSCHVAHNSHKIRMVQDYAVHTILLELHHEMRVVASGRVCVSCAGVLSCGSAEAALLCWLAAG